MKVVCVYARKSHMSTEAQIHAFFNLTLDRVECLASWLCNDRERAPVTYGWDDRVGHNEQHKINECFLESLLSFFKLVKIKIS